MGAQFTIPLIEVIPGQLIASALWNNEWNNLNTNFIPAGMDSYSDTDGQMQIQTNPFPGSVTSHATSLGGEIERIRYQLAQLLGSTYWYNPVPTYGAGIPFSLNTASFVVVPIGGIIDYPAVTPPNSSFVIPVGQALSRTTYASLFSIISVTFGVGDGSTTFNLPNYTDRMSIAAGNLYGIGVTGGATSQILAKNQIPSGLLTLNDPGHTHTITDPDHTHGITDPLHSHTEQYKTGGNTGNTVGATASQANGSATSSGAPNNVAASTGVTVNSAATGITGANSNTTGVNLTDNGGSTPVSILNPYLGMYKMMRIA